MKKLIIFFLGVYIFVNTISVQAKNQQNDYKELKTLISAKLQPWVDLKMVKMTESGTDKLINSVSLHPVSEDPFTYKISKQATISTSGYNDNHKLKISIMRPLVLERLGPRISASEIIKDTHVSFQNKELTVLHPIELNLENNQIEGTLTISARVDKTFKTGTYLGELTLKIEEAT